MKTITSTSLLAALLVLSSCWPTVEKHISPQPPSAKVIFIAEDLSLSARHLNWTQEALVEIILADSLEAEITLAGMFIGNESYKQTPFLAGMIRPNIQPLSGQENVYQESRIRQQNAINRKRFEEETRAAVSKLFHYLKKPRDHKQTDLYGALSKAEIFLTQPAFCKAKIDFFLISDLRHDLPGSSAQQVFRYPSNVRIISVGRDQEIHLERLFPDQTVVEIVELRHQFL
jgi:hypothetical protein